MSYKFATVIIVVSVRFLDMFFGEILSIIGKLNEYLQTIKLLGLFKQVIRMLCRKSSYSKTCFIRTRFWKLGFYSSVRCFRERPEEEGGGTKEERFLAWGTFIHSFRQHGIA